MRVFGAEESLVRRRSRAKICVDNAGIFCRFSAILARNARASAEFASGNSHDVAAGIARVGVVFGAEKSARSAARSRNFAAENS